MPTIPTILAQAPICQYLASNDYQKQLFLKGGSNAPLERLTRLIYIVRKSLLWDYTRDNTDTTLTGVANYLYWLCGKYNATAAAILNGGGTGTIINPATGVASTIQALFYDPIVDGVGTPTLVNGQTSIVIPDDFILSNSITVVVDTVPIQYGVYTDRLSYTVAYTDADATITIYNGDPNGGLQSGWNVEIRGLKFVAI